LTSINEVAEAVKAVIILKEAVAKHDKLIEAIADKLDAINARLDRLEMQPKRRKR